MEVHHHAHQGHDKKTWKSYFWEFFMLFLAVFCGSIAELQLEHYIENKREKQFIESLAEDIKNDIGIIERGIKRTKNLILGRDSLVQLINRGINSGQQIDSFYALHKKYIGITAPFQFSKRTVTQLLSSGNLRLIQKTNVADSISVYVSRVDYFEKQLLPQFIYYDEKTIDASERLIDTKYFLSSTIDEKYLPTEKSFLASNDLALLKAFAFRVEIEKECNMITVKTLQIIGNKAERLLKLLEEEYNLK